MNPEHTEPVLSNGSHLTELGPEAAEAARALELTIWTVTELVVTHPEGAEARLEPIWQSQDRLAWALVRHAFGAEGAPAPAELAAAARAHLARLRELPGGIMEMAEEALAPEDGAPAPPYVPSVAVNEAALELMGRDAMVVRHEGGVGVLWRELTPAQAARRVEERMLDRAEIWAVDDPLRLLELEAARWIFELHSEPGDDAWEVRMREWALAERRALAAGRTMLAALVDEGAHRDWPERQRRMAEAVAAEGVIRGVWEVGEPRDGRVTLTEADGGAIYEVPDPGIPTPAVALGRLIPVGDGTLALSAGAYAVATRTDDAPSVLADIVRELVQRIPGPGPGPLFEAVVSGIRGVRVPRRVLPAASAADAAKTLADAADALAAACLPALPADPDADPAGVEELGDPAMDMWLAALRDQARGNRAARARRLRRTQREKKRRR